MDEALRSSSEEFLSQVAFPAALDLREPFFRALVGGKRFRALCAYVGAAVQSSLGDDDSPSAALARSGTEPSVLHLGLALETYQASALVHDDLLDDSPLRRGAPSAHMHFQDVHARQKLLGSRTDFGRDGSVLLGNLLAASAEYQLGRAVEGSAAAGPVLRTYAHMTGEVAVGQAADTSAPYTPLRTGEDGVFNAVEVVKRKSARYSVVYPTVLGALLSGADEDVTAQLWAILEPAGIAFQLRDDHLGVFGHEDVTGKPTGLDIVEGKRTALLALTLTNCPPSAASELQGVYLRAHPSPDDVALATEIIREFGEQPHLSLIEAYRRLAVQALQDSDAFGSEGKELLRQLVSMLVDREA